MTLEERVSRLEKIVDRLLGGVDHDHTAKDWRSTIGMFDSDPVMKEIIDEGRRLRDEDRRRTAP